MRLTRPQPYGEPGVVHETGDWASRRSALPRQPCQHLGRRFTGDKARASDGDASQTGLLAFRDAGPFLSDDGRDPADYCIPASQFMRAQ